MAYITGDRNQIALLPVAVEDYISKDDPVRVYDAFIESLNFNKLEIAIEPYKSGAHEYYPKTILKILVYGYSYGIRSSRKLERACYHNLSFIWLSGNIRPDYRTIARFRKENKESIKKVLKQCVELCIKLNVIDGNILFLDGSKFRANAGISKTWTKERCKEYIEKINKHIDEIVEESEKTDKEEEPLGTMVKLEEEIKNENKLVEKVKRILKEIEETEKTHINKTDPESVTAKGRQGTHASYNAQMVVDEKYGLIVSNEAVSENNDLNQLSGQVKIAEEMLGKKPEIVCADSGYSSMKDIKEIDKKITIVVPSQKQIQKERDEENIDKFDKEKFIYNEEKDEYKCPEGKILEYTREKDSTGKMEYRAKGEECVVCKHFGECTKTTKGRTITRLEDEKLKEQTEKIYNSKEGQKIYKLRKEKVELPFGHMKKNLGAGQFMMRGRSGVNAELSILSSCFNIARMITLIGIPALIASLSKVNCFDNL